MKIKITHLRELIERKFYEKDFPQEQIEKITDYLIWAEMSGIHTQWIVKMFWTEPLQDIIPQYDFKVQKETPCSVLIDGGKNSSIFMSQVATERVIEKAKKVGIAITWVRNTFSSNGAQSYYLKQICDNNLIGLVCARSPWAIAPYNSISPLFWTNPIGFWFPTNSWNLIFDMASSAITFYGLLVAADKWEEIDKNLAINSTGDTTSNPKDALAWAILPFDRSYKSSNLAMMVELLSWPLLNSSYCDYKTFDQEWWCTFIAIDPNILWDIEDFKQRSTDMVNIIRSSNTKKEESIRLPWDKSSKIYEESESRWEVEVDDLYLKKLGYTF